uniref:Uncharacterized protein n=1 Tax=Arundo donax TaxID=35708 RepID=A0A0A9B092_ARUDO
MVLSGIAKKSRAIADTTGYLLAFVFHQLKISKLSSVLTSSSSRYASSSDFGIRLPLLWDHWTNSSSTRILPRTGESEVLPTALKQAELAFFLLRSFSYLQSTWSTNL